MARTREILAVLLGCLNLLQAHSSGSLAFVHEPLDIPQRGAFNVYFHYNFSQEQHVVVDILSEEEVHGSGGITVPAGSGTRALRVNWNHEVSASQVDMRMWAVDEKHYAADPIHAWNDHTLSSHFTGVRIAPHLRVAMSALVLPSPVGQPASNSTRTLAAQSDAECRQACHADVFCLAVGFSPGLKDCAVFGEIPKVAAGNSDVMYSFKETEDSGSLTSDPAAVVASKRRLLQAPAPAPPTPSFQESTTFRHLANFWSLDGTQEFTIGMGKRERYKFGLVSLNNQSNVDVEDPCFKPYVHIIQTNTQPTWDAIASIYSKGGPGGPALQPSPNDPDGTRLGQMKYGGPLISVVNVPKEAIQGFHNDMIEQLTVDAGEKGQAALTFLQNHQLSTQGGNDPTLNMATQTPTDNRAIIIPVYTCKYSNQEHAGMVSCVVLLVASVILSGKFIGH